MRSPGEAGLLHAATTTATSPGSKRSRTAARSPSSLDASAAIAANTSSSAAPRATSSATRRSAACSSASTRSSARACAAEIAVLASSAKSARWASIAGGIGSRPATISAPQSPPCRRIGTPALVEKPNRLAICGQRPDIAPRSSMRVARPVRHTRWTDPSPLPGARIPSAKVAGAPSSATISLAPSGATKRRTMPNSTPASRDAWTATAWSTDSAGASRTVSSAIRRSAVCSSASAWSSARAWVLASAAATRSANCRSRSSVPAGSGRPLDVAVSMPHTAASTEIGAATAAAQPVGVRERVVRLAGVVVDPHDAILAPHAVGQRPGSEADPLSDRAPVRRSWRRRPAPRSAS